MPHNEWCDPQHPPTPKISVYPSVALLHNAVRGDEAGLVYFSRSKARQDIQHTLGAYCMSTEGKKKRMHDKKRLGVPRDSHYNKFTKKTASTTQRIQEGIKNASKLENRQKLSALQQRGANDNMHQD